MSGRRADGQSLGVAGRLAVLVVLAVGLFLARLDPFTLLFFVSYAAIGALLAIRRPRNPIGWLLVVAAFGFVGTTTPVDFDVAALQAGTAPWSEFLPVWVSAWSAYVTFGSFVALTLLFPSGRLPAGRARRPAIALLVLCAAIATIAAIAPTVSYNPDGGVASIAVPNRLAVLPGLPIWSDFPYDLLILPTVAALVVGVVSMLLRYRQAAGVERLQLRWLVAALAFVVLAVSAGLASLAVLGEGIGALTWIPAIVAYPTIPAAIYVAINRYRLYEIDRIISRTLGWALVTGILLAVFGGLVVGLQALLTGVTQGSTLAVAASTLVAFALFAPVRRRVQRAVDRRFDRARYDGERVVAAFAERLRGEVDLRTIASEIDRVAHGTVRPATAAVWLRVRVEDPA